MKDKCEICGSTKNLTTIAVKPTMWAYILSSCVCEECKKKIPFKDENHALKCRYKEADVAKSEAEAVVVELKDRITVLESNIQFLKGQIEAYQFCINNRR